MVETIEHYNNQFSDNDLLICCILSECINKNLPNAESKIWHKHPVWFINENPIVGYSKQKAGWRLLFWSGASFNEKKLNIIGKKFKDASIFYTSVEQINTTEIGNWLKKAAIIQWDYKNLIKRKGVLIKL